MKKTLTIIILCLVYIIIYLLQINFFSWFTIAGIKPNLFIILVLFIGLYAGKRYGSILGIIFGLGLDLLGSNIIGQTAVILGIIGFSGGYLDKVFSKLFKKDKLSSHKAKFNIFSSSIRIHKITKIL